MIGLMPKMVKNVDKSLNRLLKREGIPKQEFIVLNSTAT